MDAKTVDTLVGEFEKFQGEMIATLETQQKEVQETGVTTKETRDQVKQLETMLGSIGDGLKEAQERAKEQEGLLADLQAKMNRPGFQEGGRRPRLMTAGQRFVESAEYKEYREEGTGKSRRFALGHGFFPSKGGTLVEHQLFSPEGEKDLDSGEASAGQTIWSQRVEGIIAAPDRAFRLRDLMNVSPTSSNLIEYVVETGFTNAAAPVAERGTKPQSNITFARRSAPVEVIAHWVPATRQVLADSTQLQNYIDGRLLYGLKLREEQQILYGDGNAPNLQGILTHPDIQSYNWSAGPLATDTRIDAIRRAITLARLAEYPVTGVVLHPSAWEHIELQKDDEGRYIWVTVTEGGQPRLWRLAVVDTTAIEEDDALVGGFSLGTTLWDREDAAIRVAEEHDDFFIKNQVAILAEERVALTIHRPEAFVHVSFDHAPGAGS